MSSRRAWTLPTIRRGLLLVLALGLCSGCPFAYTGAGFYRGFPHDGAFYPRYRESPKRDARMVEKLRDADWTVRRDAADQLSRSRYISAEKVVPALLKAMRDKRAEVREAAKLTLGALASSPVWSRKINKIGEIASPALVAMLRDEDAEVRSAAAWVLHCLGGGTKAVVPALLETMRDERTEVRESARLALGMQASFFPPIDKIAVPALVTMLRDEHAEVRSAAAWVLHCFRQGRAKAAVPALAAALGDADAGVRRNAAWALGAIGGYAKEAVPELVSLLSDRDELARLAAIEALGDTCSTALEVRSAKALRNLRSAAKEALSALKRIAADTKETPAMREEARLALQKLRKLRKKAKGK